MEKFWLQGVVKDGQVLLEQPLDLPDGTVVTVMDYDPEDAPQAEEPKLIMTDEEFKEFTAYFTGKKDNKDFEDFIERVKRAQRGRTSPYPKAA